MTQTARRKYGNERVVVEGLRFDSKAEARHYLTLRLLERAGEITGLRVQPRYVLMDARKVAGKTLRAVTYTGDFEHREAQTGKMVVTDVKGVRTAVFQLKARLFRERYPDIDFRIVEA